MPRHTKALRNLTQLVIDGKAAFPDGERCWYTAKDARLSINKKVLFNDENDILYFVTTAGCHWVLAQALLIRSEQFGANQWIEGVDVKFLRRDFTHPFTNGDGRKEAAGCRICRLPWENFASLENKRDMVVPMVVYINTKADPPYPLLGRLACLEGSGTDLKEVLLKIQSDPSVCILVCKEFALQYDCHSKAAPGQMPISRGTALEPLIEEGASGSKEARTPPRTDARLTNNKSPRISCPAPGKGANIIKDVPSNSKMPGRAPSANTRRSGPEEESSMISSSLPSHDAPLPPISPPSSAMPNAIYGLSLPPDILRKMVMGNNVLQTADDIPPSIEQFPNLGSLQGLQLVPKLVREGGEEKWVFYPVLQSPANRQHFNPFGMLHTLAAAPTANHDEGIEHRQAQPRSPYTAASLDARMPNASIELPPVGSSFMPYRVDPSHSLRPDTSHRGEPAHSHRGEAPQPSVQPHNVELPPESPMHVTRNSKASPRNEQSQAADDRHTNDLYQGTTSISIMPSQDADEQWRTNIISPFALPRIMNVAAEEDLPPAYPPPNWPKSRQSTPPAVDHTNDDPGPHSARGQYKDIDPAPRPARVQYTEEDPASRSARVQYTDDSAPRPVRVQYTDDDPAPRQARVQYTDDDSAPRQARVQYTDDDPAPRQARAQYTGDDPAPMQQRVQYTDDDPAPRPARVQYIFSGSRPMSREHSTDEDEDQDMQQPDTTFRNANSSLEDPDTADTDALTRASGGASTSLNSNRSFLQIHTGAALAHTSRIRGISSNAVAPERIKRQRTVSSGWLEHETAGGGVPAAANLSKPGTPEGAAEPPLISISFMKPTLKVDQ